MPVAEKTHRTEKRPRKLISVSSTIAAAVLAYAKREDAEARIVPDKGYILATNSKWYRGVKGSWHPGIALRIRRENAGLSQAALAKLAGIAVSNISAMENGRRTVGLIIAKKLARALKCPIAEFVEKGSER
jgi:DNA-binding XRE family transcriptional regulator